MSVLSLRVTQRARRFLRATVAAFVVLGVASALAPTGQATSIPNHVSAVSSPGLSSTVVVDPQMFGVNVSGWDPWMLSSTGVAAIKSMGFNVQQFPNCPWIYNWKTNDSLNNGQWYPIPVSLDQWAEELNQTHGQGLYIVPYGFNSLGTGGATISGVEELTNYVVRHHLPITAMVIGSEEYGKWAVNLHTQQTAQRYASLSAAMAQAIHRIDPAMKVGVDYDLPANVAMPNSSANRWNRIVIKEDGPYVQFLSVHVYPLNRVQPNTAFLQSLYTALKTDVSYVRHQIEQYGRANDRQLAIWLTEFNPYGLESAQSVQPVFGAALVQSYLELMSQGVKQIDWWAMYGDAHVPQAVGTVATNTPLATGPNVPFASNGLASEAVAPQPGPENSLYPTGRAYRVMMQLVGSDAHLQIDAKLYTQYHLFAAKLTHGKRADWIFVNDGSDSLSILLDGLHATLGSSDMTEMTGVPASDPSAIENPRQQAVPALDGEVINVPRVVGTPVRSEPTLRSAMWNSDTQILTIEGNNLGSTPPKTTAAPGSGQDQSKLMVTDLTTQANYGWSYPGFATDWYGISVLKWTPSTVQLKLDGPLPGSLDVLQLSWWHIFAYLDVPSQILAINSTNNGNAAQILESSYDSQTNTVTIAGRRFGNAPPTIEAKGGGVDQGEVAIAIGNNIQYGYANPSVNIDWYGVTIDSWTHNQIVLTLSVPPARGESISVMWMATQQQITIPSS